MKVSGKSGIFLLALFLLPCAPALAGNKTSPSHFHGLVCHKDCSGHKAGYKWAKKHHVRSAAECGGRSQSFIEGCQAYAAEHGTKHSTR